jgi:type II secretory pathway component PulF
LAAAKEKEEKTWEVLERREGEVQEALGENQSLETLKVTIEQQILELANLGEATAKLTWDLEIHHTAERNAEVAAALEEEVTLYPITLIP